MIKDLQNTGLYEVYALYPEGCDIRFKAVELGVNVITIPTITKEVFQDITSVITKDANNPLAIFKMVQIELTELFRSEKLLFINSKLSIKRRSVSSFPQLKNEQLKALSFDMYIHGVSPHSVILNNYLQIPIMMKVIDCQPDSGLLAEIGGHVLVNEIYNYLGGTSLTPPQMPM